MMTFPARAPGVSSIAGSDMFTLGLLLVLIAALLAVAEAHVPSHGVLGSGAVASLAVGVALLLTSAGSATLVAVAVALAIAAAGGVSLSMMVRKALATRRLGAKNGLVGRVGVARSDCQVFVDGALWRARLWDLEDEAPLERGDPVVVEYVNGLTLTVRPAEKWEVAP
jgi:membrane-bound serine protease (ClpP class)